MGRNIGHMTPQHTSDLSAAYESWRRAVAGVLAKTRKIDADELGPEPERVLDTQTYDDLTIAPLYTPADELPEHPLPGQVPFTRGTRADGGWHVSARYGADGDVRTANRLIVDDLNNGVTSVWLGVDPDGVDGVGPGEVGAA